MIVAQNVCLDSRPTGSASATWDTTLYALHELVDFLQLPETVVPVTSIVLGYPAEDPPKRDRLPVTAMLHDEVYRTPTDADIDATYRERERRGWERYMSIPEIKAEIEAAGITSLAQYYTSKIKYDPDYFVPKSAEIQALLERQGFWESRA